MMDRFKKHLCAAMRDRLAGKKVRMPEAAGPILEAFGALSRCRSYNSVGPNPITWEALAAWSQMMRTPIKPHHADLIMALDAVWIEDAYRKDKQTAAAMPPVSDRPMQPQLFDALFGG